MGIDPRPEPDPNSKRSGMAEGYFSSGPVSAVFIIVLGDMSSFVTNVPLKVDLFRSSSYILGSAAIVDFLLSSITDTYEIKLPSSFAKLGLFDSANTRSFEADFL